MFTNNETLDFTYLPVRRMLVDDAVHYTKMGKRYGLTFCGLKVEAFIDRAEERGLEVCYQLAERTAEVVTCEDCLEEKENA